MISYIFAMDENRVIGHNGTLPWRLSEDLRYFKKITMGHPIVMGRKTFQSIGRPLPGRENIILTRDKHFFHEGITIFHSVEDLFTYIKNMNQEIFVIGGAELFNLFMPEVTKLYVTLIHHSFPGDVYFPEFSLSDWREIARQKGKKDDKNPFDYEFIIYEKI
ncbi:dihydrofolate reductase [Bacillus kwashiorkori]|uniref:dihydrofolate reductase n=1 Tax=Bacillus kwashiorkori TaxID=1522318 RepID=UPI00078538EF|nr:dihydrofolate reductase [Bacillus kwashiorkori]